MDISPSLGRGGADNYNNPWPGSRGLQGAAPDTRHHLHHPPDTSPSLPHLPHLPHLLAPEHAHNQLQRLASTYEAGHGQEDAGQAGPRVTTKPPIVWFPGDPDCGEGELGAAARLDTFQVVAFLLSVFNVASIMVSNVNNNNNNNNVNSNAESVNDNNINESNTNAQVSSMSNVGLGGRGLGRDRRSSEELARERSVEEELVREDLHSTVWELLGLVTRSHLAPSTTCLEQLFCQASELAAARGGFSSVAAEMSSLLLAQSVPSLQPRHRWRLVAAAKRGRAGLGCSEVAARCEAEDWSFLNMADTFTWSSAADRGHVERLVAWAYNKK